jgi:hypothetical protein
MVDDRYRSDPAKCVFGRWTMAAACALFTLATCARPAPTQPSMPSDAGQEGVEIQVDLGPCFGTCAVYSVTVRGDGAVDYDGKAFVAALGHRTAHVSRTAVSELVSSFDASSFERMSWQTNCPARFVSDHATLRTTLRRGGRAHAIDHNLGDGCAPPELGRLEAEVMHVLEPAIYDFIHCDGPCSNAP